MTLSKFKWQFIRRASFRTIGFVTLASVCLPSTLIAQNKTKFTAEAVKLDDKAKSTKEKEKNAELRGDKAELTAVSEYYAGYVIPKLTEAVPAELNIRRREIETDIEQISKNKNKAVRDAFNKKIYELLSNVSKNKA